MVAIDLSGCVMLSLSQKKKSSGVGWWERWQGTYALYTACVVQINFSDFIF